MGSVVVASPRGGVAPNLNSPHTHAGLQLDMITAICWLVFELLPRYVILIKLESPDDNF